MLSESFGCLETKARRIFEEGTPRRIDEGAREVVLSGDCGTHNAKILRAGAGAPRGHRRRNHKARVEVKMEGKGEFVLR